MNIELTGLTPKQVVFCQVMWSIQTIGGVNRFIATLPKSDQQECRALLQMIQLAYLDSVEDVTDAKKILDMIKEK